jgi:hypothetical protein
MATFNYAAAAAKAKVLLEKFGGPIVFNRFTDAVDEVAGTVSRAQSQTQSLVAAVLPASGGTLEAFDVRFMRDVLDSTDVRFCIVSAAGSSFQPEPKDEAVLLGETWQVMGCTPLNVAGTPVIYSVGLKRP